MESRKMRQQMQKSLDALRTLRDEIRLNMHLANMDAKDAWEKLEPKLDDAQRFAQDVTAVSKRSLEELVERFEAFRAQLERH